MKKKIIDQITVTIIFLLILTFLRFKLDLSLIPLWLGGLIGTVILESDYLFQVFLVQPELPVAQEAKKLVREGRYVAAVSMVYNRTDEIQHLTFHTIFFQVIFYLFAFFITTSSGSVLGQALVLSALLNLEVKQIKEIREFGELNRGWFYRLNVSETPKRQKIYVGVMTVLFILLTTFVVR